MKDPELNSARERLIRELEYEARVTAQFTGREEFSHAVLDAIATIPREEFVTVRNKAVAYDNRPCTIGHGQTISQPFIVAAMTDLLDLAPTDKVLEVGTGSGYQTAVLACLAARVFTIEIVAELAEAAIARLARLGFERVHVRLGDGRKGWPEEAPFDAIMVTAVAEAIPETLIDQLAPGGRMIIPVGEPNASQNLVLGRKDADGRFSKRSVLAVSFVPLVSGPPN